MKQAALDDLHLDFEQTIEIKAAPGDVFEGLIQHMCHLEGEEGRPPVKLRLERWPGGRWFRDLDGGNGHLWGFVQSIKPPTLLELFGPMFMSQPVSGHIIVRLTPVPGGTKLVFKNDMFGMIPPDVREGLSEGWDSMLAAIRRDAEK
ncbi:MAG TPA: SRPBCC domain-containing protein [Candidatus Krumholzibacteria bacterium]|nr:SRPBCC domain-containing protein [Candidatus Krumholzibacteria bacterium]